jgi:hypothetical protein
MASAWGFPNLRHYRIDHSAQGSGIERPPPLTWRFKAFQLFKRFNQFRRFEPYYGVNSLVAAVIATSHVNIHIELKHLMQPVNKLDLVSFNQKGLDFVAGERRLASKIEDQIR